MSTEQEREKKAAYMREYRKHNLSKMREQGRKAAAKRKDEKAIYDREYRKANLESIKAKKAQHYQDNREYIDKQNAEWAKANPHVGNARSKKRRANKLNAQPAWTNEGYIKLFYKGAKIQEELTGRKVHVDHIVPLQGKAVCGLHCEDNLQWLFAEDNQRKSNHFET